MAYPSAFLKDLSVENRLRGSWVKTGTSIRWPLQPPSRRWWWLGQRWLKWGWGVWQAVQRYERDRGVKTSPKVFI